MYEDAQLAVVIAACRPSQDLVELVRNISETVPLPIVLVDDGSGPDYRDVFARAEQLPAVHLLRHAVPLGTGAALKTGIDHALCTFGKLAGIVTIDADSAYDADDVLRVTGAFRAHPESLILGSRGGSILDRGVAFALLGRRLADPQSGLRVIPASLLATLLQLDATGQEFDFAMLLSARQMAVPVLEVPIQSVCAGGTRSILHSAARAIFILTARRGPVWIFCVVAALVFAILAGIEIHGFSTSHLFSQEIWFPVGLKRFMRYAAGFLVLAIPILLLTPWAFAGVIVLLLVVLTVVSVGPIPLVATVFFLISACALGSKLLRTKKVESFEAQLCATLLGMGGIIFLMTFVARLPVNYPAVWGVLLAVPIAADFRGVRQRLTYWAKMVRDATLRPGWERAAFSLLVFILIAHWFVTLKPESAVDALAVHLAVPMNIAAHHRMTYPVSRFLWSVMPMGADWSYSIVYLWGGEYAARLLNFSMLLVAVGLVYHATRRWVTPAAAFLLAASFAATPIVQMVTGSLFVENLLAALVLGMMTATWRFGETGETRFLYVAMGLGGTAMATKFGAMAFVLIALPFMIAEIARHWKSLGPAPWVKSALAFLLLLAAGLPSYVIAYRKTGDPIFPYHNREFHSPVVDPEVSFDDARFRVPLRLSTLYTMTFHSSQGYEGQDGSFGFQYLIMAPLALLGLLVVTGRPATSGAVLAVGAAVLIMRSQPNARYLYAAMPVLLVPFAGLLGWLRVNLRFLYRMLLISIVVCTVFDIYFLPSASYYHKEFCLRLPFSRAERDRYMGEAAPIRKVITYYNLHRSNSAVLLTGESTIAGLEGDIYMNHWHQYSTVQRLNRAVKLPDMLKLLESWRVQYFITHKQTPGDEVQPKSLRSLLAVCTTPEYEYGDYYLARLDPDCDPSALTARPPANPIVVPPGFYDDFDPAIVMIGDWQRDATFDRADSHTITYTDLPGSGIRFAFEGKSVTYVFTKAFNRGIAAVTIDGAAKADIDLYSSGIEWQTRSTFCCLVPGRHLIEISVTGRKNPQSTGTFVDLDSFVVR